MNSMMKHGGLVLLSALSLSACTISKSGSQTFSDGGPTFSKESDEVLAGLRSGGQPGKISLFGVIVEAKDQQAVVDERITLVQTPGKSSSTVVTTTIGKEFLPSFSNEVHPDYQNLVANKNFASLNCNAGDMALAMGLDFALRGDLKRVETPAASEISQTITANTVVICGAFALSSKTLQVFAQHLILINAAISSEIPEGLIALEAAELTVVGNNAITTHTADTSGKVPAATEIQVSVLQQLNGEGHLTLTSQGGNNIAPTGK
jgi:hypothetical protein